MTFIQIKDQYMKKTIFCGCNKKTRCKTPYLIIKKKLKDITSIQVTVPVEVINNKVMLPNYIKYPYDTDSEITE
jgi:hypothetical protein